MIISIGSDHSGFSLKNKIIEYLISKDLKVNDVGTYSEDPCDYPDFANLVCDDILDETSDRGILICGTGIGMSICANRHEGIRAALSTCEYMAMKSRQHNDSNILIMGSKIINFESSKTIIDIFLSEKFDGGRHSSRLSKIS